MKALVWQGPRTMTMQDEAQPQPLAGEVLVRVAHAGICGSELSGYLGQSSLRVPPVIMGHEFSGEIVALGESVTATNAHLAEGQLVTVNPLDYCGECDLCLSGLNQLCAKRQLIGAHRPGAFAEYVSVPAKLVSVLPDHVDTITGALTEPVGCGVRIGEHAGDVRGVDCLVIGAGPIGLLAMQVLMLNGAARVFVAEIDAQRLAMARELGAEAVNAREIDTPEFVREMTGNQGVGVAVDAVGTAQTRAHCIKALRTGGTLILSGLHEETSTLPVSELIRREIRVKGSYAYSPQNFADALMLLAEGKVRLSPWIVEAPLADGRQWFERLLEEPGSVSKVLLVP